MNTEEEAFEAVRNEDVVLWVGSGFSKYAGYPLGSELSRKLYNTIGREDRNGLNKFNLQDVSQAFVDLNSREKLNIGGVKQPTPST